MWNSCLPFPLKAVGNWLKVQGFQLDIRKKFLTVGVVKQWNKLAITIMEWVSQAYWTLLWTPFVEEILPCWGPPRILSRSLLLN